MLKLIGNLGGAVALFAPGFIEKVFQGCFVGIAPPGIKQYAVGVERSGGEN